VEEEEGEDGPDIMCIERDLLGRANYFSSRPPHIKYKHLRETV
jgi:hypothetical protein